MNKINNRRTFLKTAAIGSGALLSAPLVSLAAIDREMKAPLTVGEVMDTFIAEIPGAPLMETVDTLKSGSRDAPVSGIVTTMFATMQVIRKAIGLKANFIIAHEPVFYNHLDETAWLEKDEVYQTKRKLLEDNHITVWRNHDYIHRLNPDGVLTGVLDRLGWRQYSTDARKGSLKIPTVSLGELIDELKKKLGISMLRYIGDLSQSCRNIVFMPGAAGGNAQIGALNSIKPDVLIAGEISEWETAEYVRDAIAQGRKVALVILGHIPSEEPGSVFMADWLKKKFPATEVTHVPAGNEFSFR